MVCIPIGIPIIPIRSLIIEVMASPPVGWLLKFDRSSIYGCTLEPSVSTHNQSLPDVNCIERVSLAIPIVNKSYYISMES